MMYMLKQCSMYVHKYVCTLRCIWAPPPYSRCSTYISLVGFSLITRGWPLAFFACLINECQLGCLPACMWPFHWGRGVGKEGPYKAGENDSPRSHICRLAVNTYVTVLAKTLLFWLLPACAKYVVAARWRWCGATVAAGGPYTGCIILKWMKLDSSEG